MGRGGAVAGFALLVAATQIGWLTFSPVTTRVALELGVGVGAVGTFAALFPIVYIIVAIPAGRWLDRRLETALGVGAALTAVPLVLRLLAPSTYAWLFAMQVLLALGQPFVINGIPAAAARLVPERARPAAIAVASAAMFLGMILALVLGPHLFAAGGMVGLEALGAAAGLVGAAVTMASLAWTRPAAEEGSGRQAAGTAGGWAEEWRAIGLVFRDRAVWILAGLLAVGIGIFDALSTWLEPLLAAYGRGEAAGALLGATIAAGVVGSAALPGWVASGRRQKGFLVVATAFTAAALAMLAASQSVYWMAAWLLVDGFLLLAGFPILLDLVRRYVGLARQGTAVGVMMLTSHAAGLVVIFLVQLLLPYPAAAFLLMTAAALVGLGLALRLPPVAEAAPAAEAQPFSPG